MIYLISVIAFELKYLLSGPFQNKITNFDLCHPFKKPSAKVCDPVIHSPSVRSEGTQRSQKTEKGCPGSGQVLNLKKALLYSGSVPSQHLPSSLLSCLKHLHSCLGTTLVACKSPVVVLCGAHSFLVFQIYQLEKLLSMGSVSHSNINLLHLAWLEAFVEENGPAVPECYPAILRGSCQGSGLALCSLLPGHWESAHRSNLPITS